MQRPAFDAPASDWIVYADFLQEAADPRGELISLVHGDDAATIAAYVHKHAQSLLGAAAKPFRKGAYDLVWRHCWIESAAVRITSEDHGEHAVRALCEAPAARELRDLAIVGVTENCKPVDLTGAIAGLAGTPLAATCTTLAIVDERATRSRTQIAREYGVDENLVRWTSLAPIWTLPLEHLRLDVADCKHLDFSGLDGRHLKSFTLRALRAYDDVSNVRLDLFDALVASSWDRLEALELRLAESFLANTPLERDPYVATYSAREDDEGDPFAHDGNCRGVDYSTLEPMFAKLVRSPLRRLALTSFVSADSLFEVLGRTGLPPTLRVLDLSDSDLRERHVAWLRAHAKLLAPLEQLVLERTSLEAHHVEALAGLGPEIVHSHDASAPTYRYVIGME